MTADGLTTRDIVADLNVTSIGRGRPFVTLHGGLGFDHTSFRPALDPLADEMQVVFFDQRGNGMAVAPTEWSNVTHATYAADVEALRISLDAEQVILFGHSYGGFIALEYAHRYPQHVAGLVLCNTGPTYRHLDRILENVQRRVSATAFDEIGRWLATPSANDNALAVDILPLLPAYFHAPTSEHVKRAFGRTVFRTDAFYHALAEMAPKYDATAALSMLRMPTLVIAGADDPIFSLDCGPEALMQHLPNAELVLIEACGHYPFIEQPERFMGILNGWLKRHRIA